MKIIKIDVKLLLLFALVALIFLGASFYYYQKTCQPDSSISMVDFRVYYYAGLKLEFKDPNIYDVSDGYFIYKYSPIFALMMRIFKISSIPPARALRVWYIILFVAFLSSLRLLKKILFSRQERISFGFFDIVPLLFIFRYIILVNFYLDSAPCKWSLAVEIYDKLLLYAITSLYLFGLFLTRKELVESKYIFVLGISTLFILKPLLLNIDRAQVNIIILFLMLFFCYYLINKMDITAGIYLGIATVFKLTPFIFLIYLLCKKRLKAAFSSMLTFVGFLFIPCFRWGIRKNTELLTGWINALKLTFPHEYLQYKNQSLMAAISRFFSANSEVSILKLDSIGLNVLIALIYVLFFLLLIYFVKRKISPPAGKDESLFDLSLFMISMVMVSPVGTETTFVHLLLPIAVLVKAMLDRGLKDKIINSGLLTYIFFVLLVSSDISGDLSIIFRKYSLMTFDLIIIFFLTVYAKYSRNTS